MLSPERIAQIRQAPHGPDVAAMLDEIEASRKILAHYRWRPIAEMHEECGPCICMDIEDPGYLEIGNNYDPDFDESEWTHFAEVPKLSHAEAEELREALEATR